jgi:hypothetical protein
MVIVVMAVLVDRLTKREREEYVCGVGSLLVMSGGWAVPSEREGHFKPFILRVSSLVRNCKF